MAHSVSAISTRSSETEDAVAMAFDARREQIANMARQRANQAAQGAGSAPAEPPNPAAEAGAGAQLRPSLSPELRSLVIGAPQQPAAAHPSAALIGRLLDALRQYERP